MSDELDDINAEIQFSAVEDAEALLAAHYGEPVRPISEVCRGIQLWLNACRDNHPALDEHESNVQEFHTGRAWDEHAMSIIAHAGKSNMLARLLYSREPLRVQRCPQHDGRWSGLEWSDDRCPHGCGLTGWLPLDNPADER